MRHPWILLALLLTVVLVATAGQGKPGHLEPGPSQAACKAAITSQYGSAMAHPGVPVRITTPSACDGLPPDVVLGFIADTISQSPEGS